MQQKSSKVSPSYSSLQALPTDIVKLIIIYLVEPLELDNTMTNLSNIMLLNQQFYDILAYDTVLNNKLISLLAHYFFNDSRVNAAAILNTPYSVQKVKHSMACKQIADYLYITHCVSFKGSTPRVYASHTNPLVLLFSNKSLSLQAYKGIICSFIRAGLNINKPCSRFIKYHAMGDGVAIPITPLHAALYEDNTTLAKALIQKGAQPLSMEDVCTKGVYRSTLGLVAERGNKEFVLFLLNHTVQDDLTIEQAIHDAKRNRHESIATLILNYKKDKEVLNILQYIDFLLSLKKKYVS